MHGRKPLRKMERAYRTRNAFYGSPFLLSGGLSGLMHTGQKTVFRQVFKN